MAIRSHVIVPKTRIVKMRTCFVAFLPIQLEVHIVLEQERTAVSVIASPVAMDPWSQQRQRQQEENGKDGLVFGQFPHKVQFLCATPVAAEDQHFRGARVERQLASLV